MAATAPHNDRFLADVKMAKAADLLRLILLTRAFLETPDQQHQREHLDFVALLRLRHGRIRSGAARAEARARKPCMRPKCMQAMNRPVKSRSLTSEFRKNIQLGVAPYMRQTHGQRLDQPGQILDVTGIAEPGENAW